MSATHGFPATWLWLRRAFVVAVLALASVPATAAEAFGPPIGSAAPSIGTPPDQTGKSRSLESLMGERGLVLFFFRSADWCPFCQAQMIDLNTRIADMRRRGYNLAGISCDSPEIFARFVQRRQIEYTLLSDPKSEIIDRYGLRDPAYPPGNRAHGVPRPIIFMLDRAGVIQAKLSEDSYRVRPPAALVVETLDKLAGARK